MGSAGTHPFSLFERQRITAKDRYRALIDQLQYVARRELIFGMHVHVAVDDPEKAIQVVNGLLPHLAPLLALSASSPFWRGERTGLASSRQMVFSAFPRSGPPPRFNDYADYAAVVGQLERSGCIADYTHIWWDIRLHPRLGTIEIRICDAVTRVEDAVAIAAYCQALVKQLCERHEAGEEIPSYHRILTSENKWLAARYGLEAPVMDLAGASRIRIPVARIDQSDGPRASAARARARLRARARGRPRRSSAAGTSSDRQLRIYNANHDIVEVAREIARGDGVTPGSCLGDGSGGVEVLGRPVVEYRGSLRPASQPTGGASATRPVPPALLMSRGLRSSRRTRATASTRAAITTSPRSPPSRATCSRRGRP